VAWCLAKHRNNFTFITEHCESWQKADIATFCCHVAELG